MPLWYWQLCWYCVQQLQYIDVENLIINYCETHVRKSHMLKGQPETTFSRCAQIDFDDFSYMCNQKKDELSGNHIASCTDTAFNNCSRLWKLVPILHTYIIFSSMYHFEEFPIFKPLVCTDFCPHPHAHCTHFHSEWCTHPHVSLCACSRNCNCTFFPKK